MREIAKSGRTFLEFFEKIPKLLVFSQLQDKKIAPSPYFPYSGARRINVELNMPS